MPSPRLWSQESRTGGEGLAGGCGGGGGMGAAEAGSRRKLRAARAIAVWADVAGRKPRGMQAPPQITALAGAIFP